MGNSNKIHTTLLLVVSILITTKSFVSGATPTKMSEFETQDDSTEAEDLLHRSRRSPQLFPGRNVLSDLTQLKPPSLNDINEFRQKIANLANITAVLEHAIAAEKTARMTFQSFVNSIKEQILGVQRAVNPDPESYWKESTTCGGILVSQTGKVTYKLNDYYSNHERCTWTVRANYRSKIRITLTKCDLEKVHDYVAVTEFSNGDVPPTPSWNTKRLSTGETVLFDGPLILIHFVSDGSIRRKGFQLEFEGMGSNVNTNTVYQHFHFSETTGQFDSKNLIMNTNLSEKTLLATFVVNPSSSNGTKAELRFSISPEARDLGSEECQKASLEVFTDFANFPQGFSHGCCDKTCDTNDFLTNSGSIMGVYKLAENKMVGDFHVNWSTDLTNKQFESVDECGGLLSATLGKISYKKNSVYENNEKCIWLIYADGMKEGEIKIQLVKEGFEQHYDYVSLAFLNHDENGIFQTKFLYKSGPPVRIPASFVLVEFFSDSATFGKPLGFEIIWEVKNTRSDPSNLEFQYIAQSSGSITLSCSPPQKQNRLKFISVITNRLNVTNQLLQLQTEGTVQKEDILLLVSEKGNFSEPKEGLDTYQSKDGIAILFSKCSTTSNDVSISWKTESVATQVSNENHQFVRSEDQCGDLLYGDSGQILYKIGKEYELNERCTWIIRSKRFSSITVQLMADGFESCCDGLLINKISHADGSILPTGISLSRENRFQTLNAAAILVTFFSDHSVKGTGFVLEFQTKGDETENNFDLKHWHVKLESRPTTTHPFGPIFIETSDNLLSVDTFVFQHLEIATANISVELKMENLHTNACNQDSIALFHMPTVGQYEMLRKIPKTELCAVERVVGTNPFSSFLVPKSENFQPRGILVSVTKIFQGKSDKVVSLKFEEVYKEI